MGVDQEWRVGENSVAVWLGGIVPCLAHQGRRRIALKRGCSLYTYDTTSLANGVGKPGEFAEDVVLGAIGSRWWCPAIPVTVYRNVSGSLQNRYDIGNRCSRGEGIWWKEVVAEERLLDLGYLFIQVQDDIVASLIQPNVGRGRL